MSDIVLKSINHTYNVLNGLQSRVAHLFSSHKINLFQNYTKWYPIIVIFDVTTILGKM